MPSVFFGYPSRPGAVGDVIRRVATRLPGLDGVTWQSLYTDGQVVMRQVCDAIYASSFCIFDVTYPNENVLYEAGYALGIGKPMWLTMDATIGDAKRGWSELGILKPIGYTSYRNSDDLIARFTATDPIEETEPLYDTLIEPSLPEDTTRTSILYRSTFEPFEASNRLTTYINDRSRRGMQVVISDPAESSFESLQWYAEKLGNTAGLLINFAGAKRNLADVHNQRNAFIAGLAFGLEIPMLMLAEDDYARPFDYEELLQVYDSAPSCVSSARAWLDGLKMDRVTAARSTTLRRSRLAGLRFGEHVAENELSDLSEYFVRTSAYEDVLLARDTLFVGHRGTGKTANAMQAYQEIASRRENLHCS